MDDFGASSFFDCVSTTPSSGMDNNSNLEASVKRESSVWIQGFPEVAGMNNTFTPIKNDFIDSLISDSDISHTPSPVGDPLDPMEMILNPVLTEIQSIPTTVQSSVNADPDAALLNALNAASSLQPARDTTSVNFGLTGGFTPIQVKQEPEQSDSKENVHNGVENEAAEDEVKPKEINPEKELGLKISNVVTSFRVRCHLNLRRIAQEGMNVVYQKESKKIVMRIRNPSCTAYMWSSGKIICTGASSESNARKASRKFAKRLQKLGFQVIFSNYKVINVLASCKMPYHINIIDFSHFYKSKFLSYEPEIHPAVTYRMPEMRVTFKIFSTGSITLTCPVVARIPEAIKKIYPMVVHFFKLDKPTINAPCMSRVSEDEDVSDEEVIDS